MPWYKSDKFLKPFYMADYAPDSNGVLRAPRPKHCPLAVEGETGECRPTLADRRTRKCGPGYALDVLSCGNHSCCFTIYPTGWVPFGRSPLSDLANAAIDLAERCPWPDQANTKKPTRKTQVRHVLALTFLLGIEPSQSLSERHTLSISLEVPLLTLEGAAKQIRAGPTPKRRAEACTELMRGPQAPKWESIFEAGSQIGFWGKPCNHSSLVG